MRRTVIDGETLLKKQLLERISQHPNRDVAKFVDELLRFADFSISEVYLLKELVQDIEEYIKDLEFSEGFDAPHPVIKAQVKSHKNSVRSENYLYIRRRPSGKPRQEKSCGSIPFKPECLYLIKSKSTGQVRIARCSKVYIPQGATWEDLIRQPECRVKLEFLDDNYKYVASEIFSFPQCMKEDLSPHLCTIEAIKSVREDVRPPLEPLAEMTQCAASKSSGRSIDLSRARTHVYSSIPVKNHLDEDVVNFLTDCIELSQILPGCNWSLRQLPNRSVVVDGNQKEIIAYGSNCLSLMMAPDAFLNLLEQIAATVLESDSASRSWREKARKLNLRVLAASRHQGDRAFSTLFKLKK